MQLNVKQARAIAQIVQQYNFSAEDMDSHIQYWKEREPLIRSSIYSSVLRGSSSTNVNVGTLTVSLWVLIRSMLEIEGFRVELVRSGEGLDNLGEWINIRWL